MKKKKESFFLIFAKYFKSHIPMFSLDLVCAMLMSLIDLAFPLVSKYALQSLLPEQEYSVFFIVIGSVLLAYILRTAMVYIVTYLGHQLGVRIEASMRRDLFAHLQELPFSFYDKSRTGYLMSRCTSDLFEITELAHHGPEDLFIAGITLIGACIIMLTIEWRLALALIVSIPLILLFVMSQRKRMGRSSRQVKERTAQINAGIESSISGAKVAKAFTNEEYEVEKFDVGNERFVRSKKDFYKSMGSFTAGMEFYTAFLNVLVLGLGGYLIMKGTMDLVVLVTFTLYISTFTSPIKRLTSFAEMFAQGMAGFSRFRELMNTKPDIVDAPDAEDVENVRGEIEFKNVSFSYDKGASVLHDVNLHIEAGKTLALVGPSGGGKTTLCHLLPRFYETTEGAIYLDGKDTRKITLRSLRGNIGIVQQEVFLFADTIRENIRYGRINATDEEIVAAAKAAEIHDDIMAMPDGYDTVVGERGTMLSGGQKQRVSIARIFLKNPPVLILDEATSALDTATEARITAAFDRLSCGRTTLIIAHRLSTVRNADEIIVIDEKGIRERGTHDELMALNGEYAQLHSTNLGN